MKILFIGNSYTYYNDMPNIFASLAVTNCKDTSVFSVTKGGHKLSEFFDADDECMPKLEELLMQHKFDVIILQEHSIYPILHYNTFKDGVVRLIDKIGRNNNSRFILYATWARKEGSQTLIDNGWSRKEMEYKITAAYHMLASELALEVSRVGEAFHFIYNNSPGIELYNPDLTHPSYLGSCLSALTHYKTIFGDFPDNTSALNISPSTIDAFRNALN